MKIVAPIAAIEQVQPVIDAGADEIYCGVLTGRRKKGYTNLGSLNNRPMIFANLKSFQELEKVVKSAHSRNVPVNFALNYFYREGDYPSVFEQVEKAVDSHVDALMVSDVGLLSGLKKKSYSVPDVHISSLGTTFNSQTVRFYQEFGAKRIVLPRHSTLEEIGVLARVSPPVELEIFILNDRCRNVDGFCNFQDGLLELRHSRLLRFESSKAGKRLTGLMPEKMTSLLRNSLRKSHMGCSLNYDVTVVNDAPSDVKRNGNQDFSPLFDITTFLKACGACALYDLSQMDIGFVKIIGRQSPLKKKVKDVRFIRSSLDLLKKELTKGEFQEKVRELYQRFHSSPCNQRYCYYRGP